MTRRRAREALAAALALALLFLASGAGGPAAATHSSSTIRLLAIDANSDGNTATSLGTIDGCAFGDVGARVSVDYIVDSIPQDRPLIGFEVEVRYDPQLLEVVDLDPDLLLAAVGSYSPFSGLSDPLPDSDGSMRISVLDTASASDPEANVERGPGVLARIGFRARAAGVSQITIALEQDPPLYPLVLDTRNEMIFADNLGGASIAVGRPCPPPAQEPVITDLTPINEEIIAEHPELLGASTTSPGASAAATSVPTPNGPSASPDLPPASSTPPHQGDGSDTVPIVLILLALGAVALAGGGWYLYRRSRSGGASG